MKITCFGEALWDIFPTHKKVGGAPLNVALRLHTLGFETELITRIGDDELGNNLKEILHEKHFNTIGLQLDRSYGTGEVKVSVDNQGVASYDICQPVAWDFIDANDNAKDCVVNSDAFVFGSLASRSEVSRKTLFELLKIAKFKVLDVNLRPPFYTLDLLNKLMNKSDFIKVNEEELEEICSSFFENENTSLEGKINKLARHTSCNKICVTKGGKGATLFYEGIFYHNSGYKVDVIDTVGSGDSFLALLISELLNNQDPQKALNMACAMGALVAASEGANPIFSKEELENFIKK